MNKTIKPTLDDMSIKQVFDQEEVKKKFREMLGKKATGFIVSLINVISNNDNLVNADKQSILFAAAIAGAIDLPINPNLGFAYIVPFKDRKSGIQKAQFQMGYKGFIQLAQRSGTFKTISAAPIYEGQLIEENPLLGYKFDFTKKKNDKVIGYAGFFQLINGFEKTMYMTVDELKKHGSKYSQTFKRGFGLWKDNFDAMAVKTVLKLLLSKYAPLSIEMQKAVITDQSVVNNWDGTQVEYPDNKPETLDDAVNRKEEERVKQHIKDSKTKKELYEALEYVTTLSKDHELRELFAKKEAKLLKKKK